jgi:hypothetical protein
MRLALRKENCVTGARRKELVSVVEVHVSFENVVKFVLPLMDMGRRLIARPASIFQERNAAARLITRGEKRHHASHIEHRRSEIGAAAIGPPGNHPVARRLRIVFHPSLL